MKKTFFLTAVAFSMLLAGCDNSDDIDQSKLDSYERFFEERFGKIDVNHNFNMVRVVGITPDASISNYTLKVYDNTPDVGLGAHLLGEFKIANGNGKELKCDVPRIVNRLYFAFVKDGTTTYSVADVTSSNKVQAKYDGTATSASAFIAPSDNTQQATPKEDTPMVYTIAYEDLNTTDDFDFNDLVLQITHVSGSTNAVVKAKCAGGLLPIQVNFGDEVIWARINSAYGLWDNKVVINTESTTTIEEEGEYYQVRTISFDPTKTITVPEDFTISENASEFYIVVTYEDDKDSDLAQVWIRPNVTNKIPQVIVLAYDNWLWPREHTPIDKGYPWFSEWVQDKTKLEWTTKDVIIEYLYGIGININ